MRVGRIRDEQHEALRDEAVDDLLDVLAADSAGAGEGGHRLRAVPD